MNMSLLNRVRDALSNLGNNGRRIVESPDMNNYKSDDKYLNFLRYRYQKIQEKHEREKLREYVKNYEKAQERKFMFENKICNKKQNINKFKQPLYFKTKTDFSNNNAFMRR